MPYLSAHGVRLARVHFAADGENLPSEIEQTAHVLLELPDHLGSTSIVVDATTSEVVERGTYMAYGQADSDYRPARWGSFREDYRFTGKEEDVEVGLTYFGKRFLSAYLGRWASADPLTVHGRSGDPNAYAYVHSRLLRNTDPIGLDNDPDAGAAPIAGAPPQKAEEVATTPPQSTESPSNGLASPASPPARATPTPSPLSSLGGNLTVTMRSYAPFNVFGFGFAGDSRGPTTSPTVTSRITTEVQIDTSTSSSTVTAWSNRSEWPADSKIPFAQTGTPMGRSQMGTDSSGTSVSITHEGANPLLRHIAPDIDLHATIRFEFLRGGSNDVRVTTHMVGDAFPNAEIFLTLPTGDRIMLHHFETTGSKNIGPLLLLPFDLARDMGTTSVVIPRGPSVPPKTESPTK